MGLSGTHLGICKWNDLLLALRWTTFLGPSNVVQRMNRYQKRDVAQRQLAHSRPFQAMPGGVIAEALTWRARVRNEGLHYKLRNFPLNRRGFSPEQLVMNLEESQRK